ncbi:Phosphoribosyl-ATP pyrophosphatase [Clostridium bornimense]|uniref:Phosphoribosyl-ATP pyrophosphatase n=1 Tax=Clostridium bornimense TaxID=1216932 RepID=W6RX54_9CLOT|nr:phosphoribosyl-ATP diphosphatase [Clostridium bornimense]CDM68953.1 Phosphoribosyl-ATP pyrophosphatase [Clostridium bornimense]
MSNVINDLYEVVKDRLDNPVENSYTNYLFNKGTDKILKKVGEECTEVIIAAKGDSKEDMVAEICDLLYHLEVLMVDRGIEITSVEEELKKRSAKIGNSKGDRKEITKL